MSRMARVLGVLLVLAIAAGCATTEEQRCRSSGGAWRGTFCERPAN